MGALKPLKREVSTRGEVLRVELEGTYHLSRK